MDTVARGKIRRPIREVKREHNGTKLDPMTAERRSYFRRGSDKDPGLDRDDLFLLLESYRNTIELNTTLLERQEILNNRMEKVLTEVVKICGNQCAIASEIGKLPGQLQLLIESLRTAEIKDHSGLKLQIYAAFTILGGLTIALLSLLVKIWPKTPLYFPGP
jgi:hypothetical protein